MKIILTCGYKDESLYITVNDYVGLAKFWMYILFEETGFHQTLLVNYVSNNRNNFFLVEQLLSPNK